MIYKIKRGRPVCTSAIMKSVIDVDSAECELRSGECDDILLWKREFCSLCGRL